LSQFPSFRHLLNDLAKNQLDKHARSREKRERWEQTKINLEREKVQYLQQYTLYSELKDLIIDTKIGNFGQTTNTLLWEKEISRAEAMSYDCKRNISHEKNPKYKNDEAPSKIETKPNRDGLGFLPDVERRLITKCETIYDFYDPQIEAGSGPVLLFPNLQLHAIIKQRKLLLDREAELVDIDRRSNERAFVECYKIKSQIAQIIGETLKEYKFKVHVEQDTLNARWLQDRCRAMLLKLRVVKQQILMDTYSPSALGALRVVRSHLDEKRKQIMEDWAKTEDGVRLYESIGMGFDKLVEEYAEILEEIRNKEWAIRQLREDDDLNQSM